MFSHDVAGLRQQGDDGALTPSEVIIKGSGAALLCQCHIRGHSEFVVCRLVKCCCKTAKGVKDTGVIIDIPPSH